MGWAHSHTHTQTLRISTQAYSSCQKPPCEIHFPRARLGFYIIPKYTICAFHSTSASLGEYIQYFFFISIINYEVPLTSSLLLKSCMEYKETPMAACRMLSPLCLNASRASWGCAEYRLRMPEPAAHVQSHSSTLGSHFQGSV